MIQLGGDLRQSSCLTRCSEEDWLWDQSRWLGALASLILKTSKDGDGTVFLGNLFHCLIILIEKKVFLIWSKNLCSFISHLLSLVLQSCTTVWRASLHLLNSLPTGTGRLLLGPPKVFPSPCWTSHGPSAFPHRTSTPTLPNRLHGPSLHSLQLILYWACKTLCSIPDVV